jgi:hypothetical protein
MLWVQITAAMLQREMEEEEEMNRTVSDASSTSAEESEEELEGGSEPHRVFLRQLKKANMSPVEYLRQARRAANAAGYDGRALEFSDDDEHKLMIYDDKGTPRRFGRVGYNDYLLWKNEEAMGRVKSGYADQKRNVFNRSHKKMPGEWKSDKFSPNMLALKILWA